MNDDSDGIVFDEPNVDIQPVEENKTSFISTVRQWLFPSADEWMEGMMGRLSAFDDAIEQYPETPSNYVYRGEIYLKIWHYKAAIDDFEQALQLVSDEWNERDWGFIIQIVQDRAFRGLELARKQQSHNTINLIELDGFVE